MLITGLVSTCVIGGYLNKYRGELGIIKFIISFFKFASIPILQMGSKPVSKKVSYSDMTLHDRARGSGYSEMFAKRTS